MPDVYQEYGVVQPGPGGWNLLAENESSYMEAEEEAVRILAETDDEPSLLILEFDVSWDDEGEDEVVVDSREIESISCDDSRVTALRRGMGLPPRSPASPEATC